METTDILRHQLATLHYRTSKALEDAPPGFGDFDAGEGVRTPTEILRHMSALVGHTRARLEVGEWSPAAAAGFDVEFERLRREIVETIRVLGAVEPSRNAVELLVQGPLADAMTHVGQLTMLRRLTGSPIRGESYVEAEIAPEVLAGDAELADGAE